MCTHVSFHTSLLQQLFFSNTHFSVLVSALPSCILVCAVCSHALVVGLVSLRFQFVCIFSCCSFIVAHCSFCWCFRLHSHLCVVPMSCLLLCKGHACFFVLSLCAWGPCGAQMRQHRAWCSLLLKHHATPCCFTFLLCCGVAIEFEQLCRLAFGSTSVPNSGSLFRHRFRGAPRRSPTVRSWSLPPLF
jgi:hypothetical protein